MLNVLLVDCAQRKNKVDFRYEGLALPYLASYLRKYGNDYNVRIVDYDQFCQSILVSDFQPDIVGLSSITQNYDLAKNVARIIGEYMWWVPVVVGGYHISALPNNLTSYMDFGVIGEGEVTFLELCNCVSDDHLDFMRDVNGVAFWHDGELIVNKARELIRPLDEIPFPARDLIKNNGKFYMFTSRGCCYNCRFCSSTSFWGCVRYFSAEYVVSEICSLVDNYGVSTIGFYDDVFVGNIKRLRSIVRLVKNSGVNVVFSCLARSNLVNDEVASLLSSMNVNSVSMGLESGNSRILNYLKGDSVSVLDNVNAVKVLHKYGIKVGASFVIGCPDETESEVLDTLRFVKDKCIDFGETYVLMPFPDTDVWYECKDKGLVSDDMDWSKFSLKLDGHRLVVAEGVSRERLFVLMDMFKRLWKGKFLRYGVLHPSRAVKKFRSLF